MDTHQEVISVTPEMARAHLLAWNMYSSAGLYKPYWHCAHLCERLMAMLAGKARNRMIIQMPPQHFKSTTTTEGLATYFLGCNPDKRVGICSYGAELAEDFGYRNRCRMEEYAPTVFGLEVDKVRKSKNNWCFKDHFNGGMVSVGVGGALTGKRLDLLIIDDALKNFEEAQSANQREAVWNWLTTVTMTRLSRGAPVVVIGTRWHPDDHMGRLIRQSQSNDSRTWELITLAAVATQDEYDAQGRLLRCKGEALCPEKHTMDELDEIRSMMTPFQWSALYQQDPTQPEGCHWPPDLFNERVIVDDWPEGLKYLVLALDPSSGRDQKNGDYPAICALGTRGDGLFYMDFLMQRAAPTQIAHNLVDYIMKLKAKTGVTPQLLGVEQVGLWELYAEKIIGQFERNGIWVPITEVSHQSRDKILRIQRLDPLISNREIRFINSLGTRIALDQFRDFPTGKHDDAPDSAEMACRIFPKAVYGR